MTFRGRGYALPKITTTATASGVTYRVDCAERAEPWCEFHLTPLDVIHAVNLMNEAAAQSFPAAEPELGEAGA